MSMEYDKNDRLIALGEIAGALAFVGFWIGWFLGFLKALEPDNAAYDSYIDFESAFPIPDTWIVALLLISAYGILRNEPFGRLVAIAAGGALVFLGLVDISFNFQQNIYSYDPLAFALNIICVASGIFLIAWFISFSSTCEKKELEINRPSKD
ncbi:MAG: hypothetical protein ACFFB3_15105 [Candidatus Hodarchaeota archaeon]